jgi:hypothetical protein
MDVVDVMAAYLPVVRVGTAQSRVVILAQSRVVILAQSREVILAVRSIEFPDDRSLVIQNMLEQF